MLNRTPCRLLLPFLCVVLATGCGGGTSPSNTTSPPSGNGGGGSGGTALASGGATALYVVQLPTDGTAASVLQFSISPTSISGPTASLTLPLGFQLTAVATDSTGQIYAGGYVIQSVPIGEVLIYAAGATGSASPLRTLTGTTGNFYGPQSMAVDGAGNLYLLNGAGSQTVSVYAPTATGAAAPVRQISGALTQIALNPFGIAVDRAGTVYVSSHLAYGTGQILAFAPGASGNVAPARIISGAATTLYTLYSMDTDAAGNLYVASYVAPTSASILKFGATANGNVAPLNTIAGSSTGLLQVEGIRVDAAGNIYVGGGTLTPSGLPPALQAFAPSASGNVLPAFTLSSSAWNSPGYYFQLALR